MSSKHQDTKVESDAKVKRQFRKLKPSSNTLFLSFLLRHFQCFFFTLGQLSKTPIATLMTSAALGIALALPAGLYEVVLTLQKAGGELDHVHQVTLFLKKEINDQQAKDLQEKIQGMEGVLNVQFKDKQQALEEFQHYSGFGDALDALEFNPLPHVLIIAPSPLYVEPLNLEKLLSIFKQIEEVETVQVDMQWLKRLFSIISVGKTGISIIACLLGLAVLLIIGNTIRLAIENRRQEILISKLIGGTNSFIRRPFLYLGFWYGFLGGVLAVILIDGALLVMDSSLGELKALYQSELLNLSTTNISHNIQLLLISIMLGLLGALVAVNRQIKDIEPT